MKRVTEEGKEFNRGMERGMDRGDDLCGVLGCRGAGLTSFDAVSPAARPRDISLSPSSRMTAQAWVSPCQLSADNTTSLPVHQVSVVTPKGALVVWVRPARSVWMCNNTH